MDIANIAKSIMTPAAVAPMVVGLVVGFMACKFLSGNKGDY